MTVPDSSILFAHTDRQAALDHPSRRALAQAIEDRPGSSIQDLAKMTGMSRTNVNHHLDVLRRHDAVVGHEYDRRWHYFPPGSGPEARTQAVLANPHLRALARIVVQRPASMQKDLCQKLGILPSRASERLQKLCDEGLVEVSAEGRALRYQPTHRLHAMMEDAPADPTFDAPHLDH